MVLRFNDAPLQQLIETKFLGIIIHQNLNWSSHIQHATSKIQKTKYIFYKLRYLFSLKTLRIVYFSLVHSHISFGLPIYGATYTTTLNQLQTAQNSIIRIMLFAKRHDSVTFAYPLLNITTATQELQLRTAILTYKLLKGIIWLSNVNLTLKIPRRDTRLASQTHLHVPHVRTNYGLHSFVYRSSILWNTIPISIRSSITLPVFKSLYRIHLMNAST